MNNGKNEEVKKGDDPPSVGGGGRNVKKTCIDQEQRGGMALKGVRGACGTIITSTWHHPETRRHMQKLMDSRDS